jgi:hypothetical protein
VSESFWRDKAAPIVAAVIANNTDPARLPAELREAYPFGVRRHHPYKIWLSEVARQLGRRTAQRQDERQEDLFA